MWNNHVELYNYTGYLEMVSTTARYKHEGESYLFWGGSLPPYPDAGGMASIQTLVRKQLIHATILAKQVEKLKSIAETENFNQALEFMKICRALVDESLVFGRGLITPSSPSSRALNMLASLIWQYGAISDTWREYKYAKHQGDKKLAKETKDSIKLKWKEVIKAQKKLEFPALAAVLILSLAPTC
eukprot:CAMPEP_0184297658 /NCGR_PEP_ID=MMETSP1049-20130417/8556_1 /TAXON_ID=77928 /ORGANISM="Proteomonas sulcata, Strain CCMP704" /LENGTH=185 /DNA_ID=CAMNT_0026607487 /DNA_START=179 /DNA_END=736 /DNA_ORIENTATION=+